MAIKNAAILQGENTALRAANTRRKQQQKTRRKVIANGGTLTIGEGLNKLDMSQSQQQSLDDAQMAEEQVEALRPKKRAAPKCSLCGSLEHNARTCPKCKT